MSTESEVLFLGYKLAATTFLNIAGLFGGLMPLIVDLIQRERQAVIERIELDASFWLMKLIVIPACALLITAFAVSSQNITSWLAAFYFGASFPMLAQKALAIKRPVAETASDE